MDRLKVDLYEQYHVEIPCIRWQDQRFVRISVLGYNTEEDIDVLAEGLELLLES